MWILSVALLAFAVAAYELAGLFGLRMPFGDLAVSAVLVGALGAVFAYIFVRTRRAEETAAA
ncbi:MAG: hypothetical protein JO103_13345 [Candidatus Eremiobacteraeota bacterium]|nr:hypothetical protein [Candidatus Eremiobacteraeota bacterium]